MGLIYLELRCCCGGGHCWPASQGERPAHSWFNVDDFQSSVSRWLRPAIIRRDSPIIIRRSGATYRPVWPPHHSQKAIHHSSSSSAPLLYSLVFSFRPVQHVDCASSFSGGRNDSDSDVTKRRWWRDRPSNENHLTIQSTHAADARTRHAPIHLKWLRVIDHLTSEKNKTTTTRRTEE